MQEGGTDQPRHQRSILDRVPEPPSAPAELVVGPIGPHGDTGRQAHPGGEQPRPHAASPGGVDTSLNQSRDRERERNREPDIAEIEQRRMESEAKGLPDRSKNAALP